MSRKRCACGFEVFGNNNKCLHCLNAQFFKSNKFRKRSRHEAIRCRNCGTVLFDVSVAGTNTLCGACLEREIEKVLPLIDTKSVVNVGSPIEQAEKIVNDIEDKIKGEVPRPILPYIEEETVRLVEF